MTTADALAEARRILGPRARVSDEFGVCVVTRHDMNEAGFSYQKEYGRGTTWAIALNAAARTYAEMRKHPKRSA
jgi:hypothetical protein